MAENNYLWAEIIKEIALGLDSSATSDALEFKNDGRSGALHNDFSADFGVAIDRETLAVQGIG